VLSLQRCVIHEVLTRKGPAPRCFYRTFTERYTKCLRVSSKGLRSRGPVKLSLALCCYAPSETYSGEELLHCAELLSVARKSLTHSCCEFLLRGPKVLVELHTKVLVEFPVASISHSRKATRDRSVSTKRYFTVLHAAQICRTGLARTPFT